MMKSVVIAMLLCASLAYAGEMYVLAGNGKMRAINNETGTSQTLFDFASAFPLGITTAAGMGGTGSASTAFNPLTAAYGSAAATLPNDPGAQVSVGAMVWHSMWKKFVVTLPFRSRAVYTIDPSTTPATVAIIAGQPGVAAATAVDGTGTVATFRYPSALLVDPNTGDLYIGDNAGVRKMTPDGAVTTPAGDLASAGIADGSGTDANFNVVNNLIWDQDGNIIASDYTTSAGTATIRKVDPTGSVTRIVGNAASDGSTDGVGTSADIARVGGMAFVGDDFDTLWIATTGNGQQGLVKKIDLATKTTSWVAGNNFGTNAPFQDGVGTDASFEEVGLGHVVVDGAGNLVISEACQAGMNIRKFDPATLTTTQFSGNKVAMMCGSKVAAGEAVETRNRDVNGDADASMYIYSNSLMAINEVCGEFFNLGEDVVISGDCEDSNGGSLPAVTVGAGKSISFKEDTTIAGALAAVGNATIFLDGGSVTAQSLSLSEQSVLKQLVSSQAPAFLTVTNAANIDGNFVAFVEAAYDLVDGESWTIMTYASKSGNFVKAFLVKLRAPRSRALLEADTVGALCGDTACTATAGTSNADDDDEVGLIVALAVVGALLLIGVCVACVMYGKNYTSSSSSPKAGYAAEGPVYSESYDVFGTYSSSSSAYSQVPYGF